MSELKTLEFEIVPQEAGLEITAKNQVELAFTPFFAKAAEWEAQAKAITDPKLARTARLEIKAIRISAEKVRKDLKEDSLRLSRAIDGANNILLNLIAPIERHLDDIEKKAEREAAAKIAQLAEARGAELAEFGFLPHGMTLGTMSEDNYSALLQQAKDAFTAKKEREAKEEADRIAKAKAEKEERERMIAENARLKKEAEEREAANRAERERLEAEAKAQRDAAEAARLEAEAKAKAERDALEAKAKKEAEEAWKLADQERQAREKAEAEIAAAKQKEAARIAEEQAAAKKAAKAPDSAKLKALAAEISALKLPELSTEEGRVAMVEIKSQISKFAAWLNKKSENI